jgi:hypothetical protein
MSTFDRSEEDAAVVMSFAWVPSGFPEDRVKELLNTFHPAVEIMGRSK